MNAVRICPDLDRECGDYERSWCSTCPKRAPLPAAPAPTKQAGTIDTPEFMELLGEYGFAVAVNDKPLADTVRDGIVVYINQWHSAALAARPAPTDSAVQHAIHNLKEHQAGRSLYFPSGAIGILERYVAARQVGAPDAERDVARVIATGYESGTMISDPSGLGATIRLHYESPAEAENAFCALSNLIDQEKAS